MGKLNSSDLDAATRSLAQKIEHTVSSAHATTSEISYACREANRLTYGAVCVSPAYVAQARREIVGKSKVAVLVGYPFGLSLSMVKAYEAENAIKEGAQEVDLILSAGRLREGEYDKICREIEVVRSAIGPSVLLKATLLFDLLDEDAKVAGTVLCLESSCDVVAVMGEKLNYRDIALMYSITHGDKAIKASGLLREWKQVERMLEAGMSRLGTAWGLNILQEQQVALQAQSAKWD